MTATEWTEVLPGIYNSENPMDVRPASSESPERLELAGFKIPCQVYSRVVGYLRPVEHWNEAKKQEFADRVPFVMPTLPCTEQEADE